MYEPHDYAHISLSDAGVPYLTGTRIKVRYIAGAQIAHGWTAAEIQHGHSELTLGQIHSALAYYYDHQQEIDDDIEAGYRYAEEMRAEQGESVVRQKLRAKGIIP